jgi:hypothetical protein
MHNRIVFYHSIHEDGTLQPKLIGVINRPTNVYVVCAFSYCIKETRGTFFQ